MLLPTLSALLCSPTPSLAAPPTLDALGTALDGEQYAMVSHEAFEALPALEGDDVPRAQYLLARALDGLAMEESARAWYAAVAEGRAPRLDPEALTALAALGDWTAFEAAIGETPIDELPASVAAAAQVRRAAIALRADDPKGALAALPDLAADDALCDPVRTIRARAAVAADDPKAARDALQGTCEDLPPGFRRARAERARIDAAALDIALSAAKGEGDAIKRTAARFGEAGPVQIAYAHALIAENRNREAIKIAKKAARKSTARDLRPEALLAEAAAWRAEGDEARVQSALVAFDIAACEVEAALDAASERSWTASRAAVDGIGSKGLRGRLLVHDGLWTLDQRYTGLRALERDAINSQEYTWRTTLGKSLMGALKEREAAIADRIAAILPAAIDDARARMVALRAEADALEQGSTEP